MSEAYEYFFPWYLENVQKKERDRKATIYINVSHLLTWQKNELKIKTSKAVGFNSALIM
jgi:hypothetical protein